MRCRGPEPTCNCINYTFTSQNQEIPITPFKNLKSFPKDKPYSRVQALLGFPACLWGLETFGGRPHCDRLALPATACKAV